MPVTPTTAVCPVCRKVFSTTVELKREFPDMECEPCLDREHLRFMQDTGRKLGLSCVPGCICQL